MYPNKSYINGTLIYSAFRLYINLNITKIDPCGPGSHFYVKLVIYSKSVFLSALLSRLYFSHSSVACWICTCNALLSARCDWRAKMGCCARAASPHSQMRVRAARPSRGGVRALEGLRSHWLFRLPDSGSISSSASSENRAPRGLRLCSHHPTREPELRGGFSSKRKTPLVDSHLSSGSDMDYP